MERRLDDFTVEDAASALWGLGALGYTVCLKVCVPFVCLFSWHETVIFTHQQQAHPVLVPMCYPRERQAPMVTNYETETQSVVLPNRHAVVPGEVIAKCSAVQSSVAGATVGGPFGGGSFFSGSG